MTAEVRGQGASTNVGEHNRQDSVVLVEPGQMGAFTKRLVALNKKGATFGLMPIEVLAVDEQIYARRYEAVGDERTLVYLAPVPPGAVVEEPVRINRVLIRYPQIRLGNWQVVGNLDAVELGNLSFTVTVDSSDAAAVRAFADHPIECQHCQSKRKRVESFVLKDHASHEYK